MNIGVNIISGLSSGTLVFLASRFFQKKKEESQKNSAIKYIIYETYLILSKTYQLLDNTKKINLNLFYKDYLFNSSDIRVFLVGSEIEQFKAIYRFYDIYQSVKEDIELFFKKSQEKIQSQKIRPDILERHFIHMESSIIDDSLKKEIVKNIRINYLDIIQKNYNEIMFLLCSNKEIKEFIYQLHNLDKNLKTDEKFNFYEKVPKFTK